MWPFNRPSKHPRRFYTRVWFWLPLSLILLATAARLALIPVSRYYTQRALDGIEGYHGTFKDVRLRILGLGYSIDGVKLVESPVVDGAAPPLQLESLDVHLLWRDLLAFNLVAVVELHGVQVVWTITKPVDVEVREKIDEIKKLLHVETFADLTRMFRALVPFRVDRIGIRETRLRIVDTFVKGAPELLFQKLEATIENITNRRRLDEDLPVIVAIKCIFQESGDLSIFLTDDPLVDEPRFGGQAELKGLELKEMDTLVASQTGMRIPKGTLDVFATFRAKDGLIDGSVKALVRNAHLVAADHDLGDKIKAALTDTAVDLLSDRVPGRDAIATTIPFRGKIASPKAELLPTILGVLRNAFVVGLVSGFANMPLPIAPEQQGVIAQAAQALSTKGSGTERQPLPPAGSKSAKHPPVKL